MLDEDIEILQDKIDDPVLCQKVEQYAKAPFAIQEMFRKDAGKVLLSFPWRLAINPRDPMNE